MSWLMTWLPAARICAGSAVHPLPCRESAQWLHGVTHPRPGSDAVAGKTKVFPAEAQSGRLIALRIRRRTRMQNRTWVYYLTAFLCGMTFMAVELTCSRLLAPYFSYSSIVWTVIIGLIMISLSLGNIIGGRSADKHRDLGRLYL